MSVASAKESETSSRDHETRDSRASSGGFGTSLASVSEAVSNQKQFKPFFEGWLTKESRVFGVKRQRWAVYTRGRKLYTFKAKHCYTNPTECIDINQYWIITEFIGDIYHPNDMGPHSSHNRRWTQERVARGWYERQLLDIAQNKAFLTGDAFNLYSVSPNASAKESLEKASLESAKTYIPPAINAKLCKKDLPQRFVFHCENRVHLEEWSFILLMSRCPEFGRRYLTIAAMNGRLDQMKKVAQFWGKDILSDDPRFIPFANGIDYGAIFAAIKYQRYGIVQYLLKNGASPNAYGSMTENEKRMTKYKKCGEVIQHRHSALTHACLLGDRKVVQLLLKQKDINFSDGWEYRDASDNDKLISTDRTSWCYVLEQYKKNPQVFKPVIELFIAQYPEKFNAINEGSGNHRPTHIICRVALTDVLKIFLATKNTNIPFNTIDTEGNTPLLCALNRYRYHKSIVSALLSYRTAEELNLSHRDSAGFNALHYAIMRGDVALVKKLVKFGADIKSYTLGRVTCYELAKQWKQPEIVQFIEELGSNVMQIEEKSDVNANEDINSDINGDENESKMEETNGTMEATTEQSSNSKTRDRRRSSLTREAIEMRGFLERRCVGCGQYWERLINNGYTSMEALMTVNPLILRDLGIRNETHCQSIVDAIQHRWKEIFDLQNKRQMKKPKTESRHVSAPFASFHSTTNRRKTEFRIVPTDAPIGNPRRLKHIRRRTSPDITDGVNSIALPNPALKTPGRSPVDSIPSKFQV